MSGIVRYGSYVPFFRLQRAAAGGGKGERAVASYDEDAASMAVEAARDVVRAAPIEIDGMLFATTSPPYAEKLNTATLHAALDLAPETSSAELGSSSRAGLSAMAIASDLATAGRATLVCASDVVTGAPGGPREAGGGDGACAFLFGSDEHSIATLLGRAASTEEVLDVWRAPDMRFAKQWEERFGADVFVPLLKDVATRALDDAGIALSDVTSVVMDSTNPRASAGALKALRVKPEQIADSLVAQVGRTGTAHAGLLLAHVLDQASAGDKILVVSGADGADALVFEVTDRIAQGRPVHSVERWIDSKRSDLGYTDYLKWRGILDFEPPRRPDPARPAAPPMRRAERWKFAFVGSRCLECQTAQLPPQRVCVNCQAVDKMEPLSFADAASNIATYTIDRLAYSLQPPVVAAVVDFDQGGRYSCQLTDVDPEKVQIGDELEMTFRLIHTADGVHNYFWKARPLR